MRHRYFIRIQGGTFTCGLTPRAPIDWKTAIAFSSSPLSLSAFISASYVVTFGAHPLASRSWKTCRRRSGVIQCRHYVSVRLCCTYNRSRWLIVPFHCTSIPAFSCRRAVRFADLSSLPGSTRMGCGTFPVGIRREGCSSLKLNSTRACLPDILTTLPPLCTGGIQKTRNDPATR